MNLATRFSATGLFRIARPSQPSRLSRLVALLSALTVLFAVTACSVLRPSSAKPPTFYALELAPPVQSAQRPAVQSPPEPKAPGAPVAPDLPTLIISPTHAASGFDSQRIIYVRNPYQLEYFAHSEWIDPPARMLGPLLVAAIEQTGAFRAVVLTPGSAAGERRLDTEIMRLQHNFQTVPSRVQFTLRATLVDDKTRRVLAWREFHAEVPATSDTPEGGVAAANQAVQSVVAELAQFLAATPR